MASTRPLFAWKVYEKPLDLITPISVEQNQFYW
jgi:hypothetical protein